MGQLNRVDVKGSRSKVVEGQILLGRDSSKSTYHEENSRIISNPWLFCGEAKLYDYIAKLAGNYVVVEYESPKPGLMIHCSSDVHMLDLYPVNRHHYDHASFETKIPLSDFHRDSGINVGRIINAARSGKHTRSWEITIQQGNSGNDFLTMSIDDEALFDFAVSSLKSARKVKVYCYKRSAHSARRGDHDIYAWKIERLADI